jgi:hypothetical protein
MWKQHQQLRVGCSAAAQQQLATGRQLGCRKQSSKFVMCLATVTVEVKF